jgi:hypothetical protein
MRPAKALPPFETARCLALAYVGGRYTPPSAHARTRRGPAAFLTLYVGKREPRLSFWTFGDDGQYWAYSQVSDVMGSTEANVDFALIRAALDYEVEFEQWRAYPLGKAERATISRLRMGNAYEHARVRLAQIQRLARIFRCRTGRATRKPMFTVRPRSTLAIERDVAEREAIDSTLYGYLKRTERRGWQRM